MEDIMNTIRCTAVLGVNREYTLEEFAERLMRDLESIYHNNADRDFISFNVLASKTCYREEWGCPREGETTFSLEAVANPIFVEDIERWKNNCIFYIQELQKIHKQKTVSILFQNVEMVYSTLSM